MYTYYVFCTCIMHCNLVKYACCVDKQFRRFGVDWLGQSNSKNPYLSQFHPKSFFRYFNVYRGKKTKKTNQTHLMKQINQQTYQNKANREKT